MLAEDPNAADYERAEHRIVDLLVKTAKREEVLGRESFLEMPSKLQNQLVVLQKQSEPKARDMAAIVAAESNLREYNARLDDAFNLKLQIEGERGRRSRTRRRDVTRGVIQVLVVAAVVGGIVYFFREEANAKTEACKQERSCDTEGLCSGRLSFAPFGMQCAAQGDDCRKSTICSTQGMCSPQQGICMARVVEDCQRSKNCVEQGLCSPFGGTCVAGDAADCRASRACHERGACLEVGGRCIAPPDFQGQPAASGSSSARPALPVTRPRLRAKPRKTTKPRSRKRPR